jgi:hypothetical protein
MGSNDLAVRHYHIIKTTKWSSFGSNKGEHSKGKEPVTPKKKVSARKISMELDISERSVRRIIKNDLGLYPYKKVIEPLLSDDQKLKRKQFVNWVRTNFRKEDTLKILFSDEKMFDIDGVYNTQNDRVVGSRSC